MAASWEGAWAHKSPCHVPSGARGGDPGSFWHVRAAGSKEALL